MYKKNISDSQEQSWARDNFVRVTITMTTRQLVRACKNVWKKSLSPSVSTICMYSEKATNNSFFILTLCHIVAKIVANAQLCGQWQWWWSPPFFFPSCSAWPEETTRMTFPVSPWFESRHAGSAVKPKILSGRSFSKLTCTVRCNFSKFCV